MACPRRHAGEGWSSTGSRCCQWSAWFAATSPGPAGRTIRRPDAREVCGGVRADHRGAVRGMAAPHESLMRARVLVRPKAGILDPQGQAVERALPALGFTGVANVHVGRLIELDVEDPARLDEMCERLLA